MSFICRDHFCSDDMPEEKLFVGLIGFALSESFGFSTVT
jgi:hypothetical protein